MRPSGIRSRPAPISWRRCIARRCSSGTCSAAALDGLAALAETLPVFFPVHPRTRTVIEASGLRRRLPGSGSWSRVGYVEFLSLVAAAAAVVTDSGGIQEETTYLGVPCFTLRDNTERPVTVDLGTNMLLGLAPERLVDVPSLLLERRESALRVPPGWDGCAAARIRDVLLAWSPPQARDRRTAVPA